MDNKILETFSFLKPYLEQKNISISENKISITYSSYLRAVLFGLFAGIVLPMIIYIIYLYLRDKGIIPYFNLDNQTEQIILLLMAIFFILLLSLSKSNSYTTIIDFSNKAIYTENHILFKTIISDYVDFKNIRKVCNNVEYQLERPRYSKEYEYEGKPYKINGKTNYYHIYYVTFLIDNGDFWNYFKMGIFHEDYVLSLKFAEAISKTLKIPLFKCKENAYIKLDYSRDITNPSLSEVLIEPCKRTYCQDEAEKVD